MKHLIRNLKNDTALLSLLTPHTYFEREALVTTSNEIHGLKIVC